MWCLKNPDDADYLTWVENGEQMKIGMEIMLLMDEIETSGGYRRKRAKSKLHKLTKILLKAAPEGKLNVSTAPQ